MDVRMGNLEGGEATLVILSEADTADICVVLVSSEPGLDGLAEEIGAMGYLDKAFGLEPLPEVISRAWERFSRSDRASRARAEAGAA